MRIERVDDLPVLCQQILESGLPGVLDEYFPDHGHWQGSSGGIVACGWLLYILSEADHRLSFVEQWAEDRICVLRSVLGFSSLRSRDFNDDRLGNLLDRYADDERWDAFENSFNKRIVKAFNVAHFNKEDSRRIRLDSMNINSFREPGELFKRGYSKQKRADMPQIKVMLATLDPIALPLAVEIVDGATADDETYLPLVNKLRDSVPKGGTLFVGDSKLGSCKNRAALVADGDYYLCPLNRKQCTASQLYEYLEKKPGQLQQIFDSPEESRSMAYFYEINHPMQDESGDLRWDERRILVYSPVYGDKFNRSLYDRLQMAEEKLTHLVVAKKGRRRLKSMADLQARATVIVKKYEVEPFLDLRLGETIEEKHVQRHKDRSAETRQIKAYTLQFTRNEAAIENELARLGWQIYASNIPPELLDTARLVECYRDEYRIEQLFHYLANKVTHLLPVYLKKEQRVKGLVRLLLLALKFSTLLQHRIRVALAENNEALTNLYPGNAQRRTQRPTATRILKAFQNISVVIMQKDRGGSSQMTDLTAVQNKILNLIGQPLLYQRLTELLNTHYDLRET